MQRPGLVTLHRRHKKAGSIPYEVSAPDSEYPGDWFRQKLSSSEHDRATMQHWPINVYLSRRHRLFLVSLLGWQKPSLRSARADGESRICRDLSAKCNDKWPRCVKHVWNSVALDNFELLLEWITCLLLTTDLLRRQYCWQITIGTIGVKVLPAVHNQTTPQTKSHASLVHFLLQLIRKRCSDASELCIKPRSH